MPITLDADSSDFDYNANMLIFRGLRMTQGMLTIEADLAESNKLDFDDGLWVFTGNVVIESESTALRCDKAMLRFKAHQLSHAELRGEPVRFEQRDLETNTVTEGRATVMIYDVLGQKVQMDGEAWFSDGANEIFGDNITYDLQARHITADSGDSGPVKILIEPPTQD
jgi:lipopolysaccharide export system protein LptA